MAIITVSLAEQKQRPLVGDEQPSPPHHPDLPPAPRPRCQGLAKLVRRGRNGRPIGYKGNGRPCKNIGSVEVNGTWYCRHCGRQYGYTL